MRNGSFWSNVVFEKEVIFNFFYFKTSVLDFEVSKSSIGKHTILCDKGLVSLIIISHFRQPIERKFSQFCNFMHMQISEMTGLRQLPIVSSVFTGLFLTFQQIRKSHTNIGERLLLVLWFLLTLLHVHHKSRWQSKSEYFWIWI